MEPDDLFGVIKGTVKTVSIHDEIQQRSQDLIQFCLQHYTQADLDRVQSLKQHYPEALVEALVDEIYFEPTFKPGAIRRNSQRYELLAKRLRAMHKIKSRLIELAFEDHDDEDEEHLKHFAIDAITIRKIYTP